MPFSHYPKANVGLYDLEADRNETNNLAAQNPRLARKLAEKVCAWYEANRLK